MGYNDNRGSAVGGDNISIKIFSSKKQLIVKE